MILISSLSVMIELRVMSCLSAADHGKFECNDRTEGDVMLVGCRSW